MFVVKLMARVFPRASVPTSEVRWLRAPLASEWSRPQAADSSRDGSSPFPPIAPQIADTFDGAFGDKAIAKRAREDPLVIFDKCVVEHRP